MNNQNYHNPQQQNYADGYNNHNQHTYLPQYNNIPNNQQFNNNRYQLQNYNNQQYYHRPKRICPVCGGVHFVFREHYVDDTPVWLILIMVLLLFVPIIGWIIDLGLKYAKSSTLYTFATCTQCGYRENVQLTYNEYVKNENKKIKKIQKEQVKKYKELKKLEKQNKRIQKKQLKEAQKKNI